MRGFNDACFVSVCACTHELQSHSVGLHSGAHTHTHTHTQNAEMCAVRISPPNPRGKFAARARNKHLQFHQYFFKDIFIARPSGNAGRAHVRCKYVHAPVGRDRCESAGQLVPAIRSAVSQYLCINHWQRCAPLITSQCQAFHIKRCANTNTQHPSLSYVVFCVRVHEILYTTNIDNSISSNIRCVRPTHEWHGDYVQGV